MVIHRYVGRAALHTNKLISQHSLRTQTYKITYHLTTSSESIAALSTMVFMAFKIAEFF